MKINPVFLSLVLMFPGIMILLSGCPGDKNASPSAVFKQPAANSCFFNGDSILVNIESDDTDGTVISVEIFIGDNSLGSIEKEPFRGSFMIRDFEAGTHILRAEATDDKGAKNEAEISIIIMSGPETFTDSRDGKVYRYVNIGPQVWMAENLAWLPSVNPATEFSDAIPMIYVLGYGGTDAEEARNEDNYLKYGALYNWEAAKSCCPEGWHLPDDREWRSLESYINSMQGPFDKTTYATLYAWWGMAAHLKHSSGWYHDQNGLNTYGFSGLPAGGVATMPFPMECAVCLDPSNKKATAWWTSTMVDEKVHVLGIWMEYPDNVGKQNHFPPHYGLSVRCIKDN